MAKSVRYEGERDAKVEDKDTLKMFKAASDQYGQSMLPESMQFSNGGGLDRPGLGSPLPEDSPLVDVQHSQADSLSEGERHRLMDLDRKNRAAQLKYGPELSPEEMKEYLMLDEKLSSAREASESGGGKP